MELLVVVGIIGLLLAVMAPTVSGIVDRARASICGNNLHQLAGMLRLNTGSAAHKPLPSAWQWYEFVFEHGAGDTLICPCDTGDEAGAIDLSDIYLVQAQGSERRFSNVQVILDTGSSPEDNQIHRETAAHGVTAGAGQALICVGSECALCRVTHTGEVKFESLIFETTHRCASTHWLCVDDGRPNWRSQVSSTILSGNPDSNIFVMHLQSVNYSSKWPDYYPGFEHASYAMSNAVNIYTPRPGQLMLVEYKKPVARVHKVGFSNDELGVDNSDKYGCLRTRHLGKANMALADGSVRELTREEFQSEYDRYTISNHIGLWAP